MGFHGSDPSKKKGSSPKTKKAKFGIKKLAKELLKKTHKSKAEDDSEFLIGTEVDTTGNQISGRSIEVLPGQETTEDCCCSRLQDDGSDRSYCEVCGRTDGRRSRRQRHVRFSTDLVTSDCPNTEVKDGSNQKKRKKHKKLRKARKVTWKAMKTSWKYLKVGLQVIANTPGMPTGTVNMTNIVNNPTHAWGRSADEPRPWT